MDARIVGRREIEDRHADIAAHRDVAPGFAQDMGDQRGGRRLAVGAGDGDERRVGRARGALASEELDVADDLDAGGLARARPSSAARDGSAARRAREPARRSRASRRARDRRARTRAAGARARAAASSSQAATSAPPATSARASTGRSRRARTARPCGRAKSRPAIMLTSASGSTRPTIASTKAMIQKRMTICGSDQPSCSK